MHGKKRFSVVVLICVVLVLAMGSPMAAVSLSLPDGLIDSGISPSPMFVYFHTVSTSMSISPSGLALANGTVSGYPGETDEVWIYLYLEQNVNGTWVTYDSWSGFFQSYKGSLSGTRYVQHGYSYRVRGSYYAWCGSEYEHVNGYTSARYY